MCLTLEHPGKCCFQCTAVAVPLPAFVVLLSAGLLGEHHPGLFCKSLGPLFPKLNSEMLGGRSTCESSLWREY